MSTGDLGVRGTCRTSRATLAALVVASLALASCSSRSIISSGGPDAGAGSNAGGQGNVSHDSGAGGVDARGGSGPRDASATDAADNTGGTTESGVGGATSTGVGGTTGGGAANGSGSTTGDGAAIDGSGLPEDGGTPNPGDAGASLCAKDDDCPPSTTTCVVSQCRFGVCEVRNAPAGALLPDIPADCHDSVCDGSGHASTNTVVDQDDTPNLDTPCLVGTCNKAGKMGTEPLAAGTRCASDDGGALCDGAGKCVECLHSSDCPTGTYCAKNRTCGAAPCTDVDCGGACPVCPVGKQCLTDFDCASAACDAVTLVCVPVQCSDHRKDGIETDVDCGGGICPRCALGESCINTYDCTSDACDALTRICIQDQCIDHRQDGLETDVDCGGVDACPRCGRDEGCNSDSDCTTNLKCAAGFRQCE